MALSDPLSDVLALLKPKAYGFRGLDVGGSWSLRFPADAVVRCYAVRAGTCQLWLDGIDMPFRLVAGDFVLLPLGHGLVMGSDLDAPRIDLERLFTTIAGETAIIDGGGGCSGLGGYFELVGSFAAQLLASLPPLVRLNTAPAHAGLWWLVERLMSELRVPRPGARLIAEHLAQTLLIEALRLHLSTGDLPERGWLTALADPQLSRALSAIHDDPGARWTVAALAKVAGLSRSTFSERFAASCGEPAISYLGRWRMMIASDRLARGEAISKIARDLGYGSESAFGVAFRRVIGVPPGRARHIV